MPPLRAVRPMQFAGLVARCLSTPASSSASIAPPANANSNSSALKYKTTSELTRAYAVLLLSQSAWLVKHSEVLLKAAYWFPGKRVTNSLLRATFFGHFCAGENATEIKPVIASLQGAGIGAILDYAVEADVGRGSAEELALQQVAAWEANAALALQMIVDAGARENKAVPAFAAVKCTSLGSPDVLMHASSILTEIKNLHASLQKEGSSGGVEVAALCKALGVSAQDEHVRDLLGSIGLDITKNPSIDFIDWMRLVDPNQLSMGPITSLIKTKPLDSHEQEQIQRTFQRLEKIAAEAARCEVKLMVDAEQTYLQPVIDHMTLQLQRQFNRDQRDVVYNTFQCYLKDSDARINLDLERARREKFCFACKLVRGAYMVRERQRAVDLQYVDPIHTTLEDTHRNYHAQVEKLLQHPDIAHFMVASHNEATVDHTVRLMNDLQRDRRAGGVSFGQLLGMSDHVSYTLGENQFRVFKYVPYGPISEVLPYLVRRAQENTGLLGSATKEMKMIKQEVWQRLTGKNKLTDLQGERRPWRVKQS